MYINICISVCICVASDNEISNLAMSGNDVANDEDENETL